MSDLFHLDKESKYEVDEVHRALNVIQVLAHVNNTSEWDNETQEHYILIY